MLLRTPHITVFLQIRLVPNFSTRKGARNKESLKTQLWGKWFYCRCLIQRLHSMLSLNSDKSLSKDFFLAKMLFVFQLELRFGHAIQFNQSLMVFVIWDFLNNFIYFDEIWWENNRSMIFFIQNSLLRAEHVWMCEIHFIMKWLQKIK